MTYFLQIAASKEVSTKFMLQIWQLSAQNQKKSLFAVAANISS